MSLIAAILALAAPQFAASVEADRQAVFARQQFAAAGFAPMAERAVDGRQVRRLLLVDPYGILGVPAAAIERDRDGRVTLTMRYRRWQTDPVALPARAWADLTALDAAAFAPRPVPPKQPSADSRMPPVPPPICHGWFARIAADGDRFANWSGCGDADGTRLAYIRRYLAIALATRPVCQMGENDDPFWAYSRCFAQGAKLDDPALDARLTPLVAEWGALPGADELGRARIALRAAREAAIGSPAWLAARDAVAKFRDIQRRRADMLIALQKIRQDGRSGSAADRARLDELAENWSAWIPTQDRNYIGLTDALLWPPAATSAAPTTPR